MSKICSICGKGPRTGHTIVRRGMEKKKDGIGLNTTGITKRRFLPNIQRIRARINGGVKTVKVCASCIRSGKVVKA